jgi:dimethylglycine dehydrogenase
MARAGIKRVINGPFTFSPDGNPLVGPSRACRGSGVRAPSWLDSASGGVGLALSQWMVNGDPGFDVWAMDVARYGEWATRSYTNVKVGETLRRFSIRFPNEELPAARPQRTTALSDVLLSRGAVMGDSSDSEHRCGTHPRLSKRRTWSRSHRSNDFEHVKNECLGVRSAVGVHEIRNSAKYEISGAGAEAFLSRLMTNRMPKVGRLVLHADVESERQADPATSRLPVRRRIGT